MKLTTTFWSEVIHTFSALYFINNKTNEIIFKTDLNNKLETYNFFKNVSKFVLTKQVMFAPDDVCYQFAVQSDMGIEPLKWFDLHLEKCILNHDIAFATTLIRKNDMIIPFGKFPMWTNKRLSKHREYKLKSKAYKYLANQVIAS